MSKKATEHLCDHISEKETLAILPFSKASLLVYYLTLEMTASVSGTIWNNCCRLPANCCWGVAYFIVVRTAFLKPQLYTSFFLRVKPSVGNTLWDDASGGELSCDRAKGSSLLRLINWLLRVLGFVRKIKTRSMHVQWNSPQLESWQDGLYGNQVECLW